MTMPHFVELEGIDVNGRTGLVAVPYIREYGNMATKMTFTLDADTAARIERTAARLQTSKSQVVREAVRAYAAQVRKLTEEERGRMLDVFDRVVPAIPARPEAEVEWEIAEIRSARRRGGRGSGGL